MSAPPLLSIRGLHLDFQTSRGTVHVLRDVDLNIPRNRIVGLVGESGSGKSTLALAILNLLPSNTVRFDGTMDFDGVNLRELSPEQMRRYRGDRISMIFQDPMTALNPVFTIGTHLIDVQRAKGGGHSRAALRARALAMLNQVGIADAEQRLKAYPHLVQRRHAAAHHDRHGTADRARSADRRRTDDGPRRHDRGPDRAPHPRPQGDVQGLHHFHLAQPGACLGTVRRRRG